MNEVLITVCCEAPAGDIDYDSADGDPDSSWVSRTVAYGHCSSCQEWSRLQVE